jgi:hypothetical protein
MPISQPKKKLQTHEESIKDVRMGLHHHHHQQQQQQQLLITSIVPLKFHELNVQVSYLVCNSFSNGLILCGFESIV